MCVCFSVGSPGKAFSRAVFFAPRSHVGFVLTEECLVVVNECSRREAALVVVNVAGEKQPSEAP